MSRHRDIRNLNIQDELDDHALSDGGDELTPDQEAQLNQGLEQIRMVIGGGDVSLLSDNSIKDVLWEYYFDVEKTIQWAVEEQQRRQIAKDRKENWGDRDTMLVREHDNEHLQYISHDQVGHYNGNENNQDYVEMNTGPRLPSIFLAQQQPGFDNEAYFAVDSPRPLKKFLSTISERTERTEPSTPFRSGRRNLLPARHSLISSPTTSYGNELDDRNSVNWQDTYQPDDPNTSRHTPSLSAMERLAKFEPPPSNFSTSTISPDDHVHLGTTSERSSSLDNIPTIPDLESKSSFPPNPKALSATPTSTMPAKSQSKLSKLASSRANSVTSISSRSTGTSVTGSIKTFPNLRPSAQSERPPSSIASSKGLPPLPPLSELRGPPSHSSTSSLVRRAIETALQLENMDRDKLTRPKLELYTSAPPVSEGSDRSKTPTPADVISVATVKEPPKSSVASPKSPKSRPMSKLAKLAQQRSESTTASVTSAQSTLNLPSPTQSATTQDFRPLSKLAILAQQKVDASRVPKLPKTTTEYLTPIANGSSVTTAITTSYQSLYSLTDPSKPNFIPRLNVVPLQTVTPNSSPSDQKQSKLALKIQRAGQKPNSPGFPSEEEIFTPSIPPLFFPSSSARITPSAFASVLISDLGPSIKDKGKGKNAKRRSKDHERRKEKSEGTSVDSHPHRSRKHKSSSKESVDHASSSRPFAFDGPSPDDIVLNARRGTHLTRKSSTPASPARA